MLLVHGQAAGGTLLTATVQLGNTCNDSPTTCAALGRTFRRTVVAVPEPASGALLLRLAGVSLTARRRNV